MLIAVLIAYPPYCAGTKKPRPVVRQRARGGVMGAGALEQPEFLSSAHGRTAVAYPELRVNVIGVRPHGV